MNLLLDTNVLLWLSNPKRQKSIGKRARRLIENGVIVYFSSLSVAELMVKSMTGKIEIVDAKKAIKSGLVELDFNANHAEAIPNFQSLARHDPFDRMILAQAQAEGLTLLTADETLLGLGLNFVVDARE